MKTIKIDKTTLPKDGECVKFTCENGEVCIGYFIEAQGIFTKTTNEECSDFISVWHVQSWEPNN